MTTNPLIRGVRSQESLKAVSYDQTRSAQPPTTAATPPPSSQHKRILGLRKSKHPTDQRRFFYNPRSKIRHDERRDSGLAPSTSTARDSQVTLNTESASNRSLRTSPSLPQLSASEDRSASASTSPKSADGFEKGSSDIPPVPQIPFVRIVTEIPAGSFDDLTLPGQIEFSNRGSMLIGGKKPHHSNGSLPSSALRSRKQSVQLPAPTSPSPKRVLSADEEVLSNRVRAKYEGTNHDTSDIVIGPKSNARREEAGGTRSDTTPRVTATLHDHTPNFSNGVQALNEDSPVGNGMPKVLIRDEKQLAGGIEDWGDVDNGDVDRYGFIVPRKPSSGSSLESPRSRSPDRPRIQRVSTILQLASEAPRRRRSKLGRDQSTRSPARSVTALSDKRPGSRNNRPTSSQSSIRGTLTSSYSKTHPSAHRMPRHRDRRCLEQAGDMLTLPPGLADIAESQEDCKAAEDLRRREREREEKWRKMARVVNHNDKRGGGMVFDFDTKSPKVIERTWKGIPDRWRATAWHAFLTSSASRRKDLPSDDELKHCFHKLQEYGSPDDVQIDIDVPRTINSHIMFRRRYRGGQRLLFRVLHAFSLQFPDTGYVQGMAALAATLLCYFDEEMTFVMLVRLWQLRGLERLYQSGFEGLMQALTEFETGWLAGGEVSSRLKELDIAPTAYGTRWYLTLFNYSIPFPAQLRVWDVFMLLGDPDERNLSTPLRTVVPHKDGGTTGGHTPADNPSYNGGLDVLHAVSAALIDGTREILLDSDFENAMKVLTSWIPIQDEELLMRVAKAEWKMHRRKA
ncbi:MAG: hypothetical protein Q9220_003145 [cf. Caloplaca sp. 1 TL-2023]